MNYDFENSMKKLEEYVLSYDNYSQLEKLQQRPYMNKCLDIVIRHIYTLHNNEELINKIHNIILKLENLTSLVAFDSIILHSNFKFYYKNMLTEDISNSVIFAYKKLNLFLTDGLAYQLTINDRFLAKPFEYNNTYLDEHGKFIIRETIKELEWLTDEFRHDGVEINVVADFYKSLTTEQLAFIYAQLQYIEHFPHYSEYGDSDGNTQNRCEKIYDAMRKRKDNEKIKFIKTIYHLGYCNTVMGSYAMLVELLKTKDYQTIYIELNKIIISYRNYIDSQGEACQFLQESLQIKKLRDEDIKNNNSVQTIYNYNSMLNAIYNKRK